MTKSPVSIRAADLPADGDQIVALYQETAHWHHDRWPTDIRVPPGAGMRSILTELLSLDDNQSFLRVAQLDERLVGLISANLNPKPSTGLDIYTGPVVWIGDLIVTASARRHGIGAMLMIAVEDWARLRQAASITLSMHSGNDAALALYENRGYRSTNVHMRKDL